MADASLFRVFPGQLLELNQGCLDWGYSNLVAYGSNSYVVIVDPQSMNRVQTLDAHPGVVIRVKWCPKTLSFANFLTNDRSKPFRLVLATGDNQGNIFIWDALLGEILTVLVGGPVVDMSWHPATHYLLAALHQLSSLVLWNVNTGQKLWHVQFKEPIISIKFNTFDPGQICAATDLGQIYFVKDFNETQKPRQIDLKYRISGTNTQTPTPAPNSTTSQPPDIADKHDFVEMKFSPHSRNIMYFLLKRRILIFDIAIHQAIGSIALDRGKAPFLQVIPCKHRSHLLFCLHRDGSITAWHKREEGYVYDLQCTLDTVTVNIHMRKSGLAILGIAAGLSPQTEKSIVGIRSDGTTLIVRYHDRVVRIDAATSPAVAAVVDSKPRPRPENNLLLKTLGIPRTGKVHSSGLLLGELLHPTASEGGLYEVIEPGKLIIAGYIPAVAADISSLCASPFQGYTYLLAIGTSSGLIQLLDFKLSKIFAEFRIASYTPVRGLRWLDLRRLIFFTTEQAEKTRYRNSIWVLDIDTGKIGNIRKKLEPESSYIRAIRPSPSGKYVVVLLKDQPFQIWDVEAGNLLKSIKLPMPLTAIAWAPPNYPPSNTIAESFIFTTPDGSTHFYKIENHVISPAPLHAQMAAGLVQCIAWQDNFLVSGDSTGSIFVWNFDKRKFNGFSSDRGSIRRLQFPPTPLPVPPLVSVRIPQRKTYRNRYSTITDPVKRVRATGNSPTPIPPFFGSSVKSIDRVRTSDSNSPTLARRIQSQQLKYNGNKDVDGDYGFPLDNRPNNNPNYPANSPGLSVSRPVVIVNDDLIDEYTGDGSTKNIPPTSANPTVPTSASGPINPASSSSSTGIFGNNLFANVFANLTGGNSTASASQPQSQPQIQPPEQTGANFPGSFSSATLTHLSSSSSSPNSSSENFFDPSLPQQGPPPPPGYPPPHHLIPTVDGRHRLIAHFANGTCVVLDLDHNVRVATSGYLNQRNLTIIAVDWVSGSQPVVACSDGAIRVLDKTMTISNSPVDASLHCFSLQAPLLLPEVEALVLKTMIMHHILPSTDEINGESTVDSIDRHAFNNIFQDRSELWNLVDPELLDAIKNITSNQNNNRKDQDSRKKKQDDEEPNTIDLKGVDIVRCALLLAQYYGSPIEIEFWTVAAYYFTRASSASSYISRSSSFRLGTTDGGTTTKPPTKHTPRTSTTQTTEKSDTDLPDYFDLLLRPERVRRLQSERAQILLERGKHTSSSHQMTQKLADINLFLGEKSSTVDLLLSCSSNADNQQHALTDALMACVVAATIDQDSFHNTVKMVAAKLMANDKVDAGIRLLCVIGRGLDACRYLQISDRWTEAAWLAKIHLSEPECKIVMTKWADHLLASNKIENIFQALCIYLTDGDIQKVLHVIQQYLPQYIDSAVIIAVAVMRDKLIDLAESSSRSTVSSVFSMYAEILRQLASTDSKTSTPTTTTPTSHLSHLVNYYSHKAKLVSSFVPPVSTSDSMDIAQNMEDSPSVNFDMKITEPTASGRNSRKIEESFRFSDDFSRSEPSNMLSNTTTSSSLFTFSSAKNQSFSDNNSNNNNDPFAGIFDSITTNSVNTMDIDELDNKSASD